MPDLVPSIFKTESFILLSLNNYIRTSGPGNGTFDNDKIVLRDDLDDAEVEDLYALIAHMACHTHTRKYA